MKRFAVLMIMVISWSFILAQTSGGPDAFGYTWKSSLHPVSPPTHSWVDITQSGTLVTGLADDNFVGPFPITNGFRYYWYNPTQFWIGSNGYISFNGTNISSPFPANIPLLGGADDYIAPLLSDLNFAGLNNPGKCYYYASADSIIVSYEDVPYWNLAAPTYTGQNTFQIILSNIDSSITFNYILNNLGLQTTLDNIIGIENVSGAIGLNPYTDSLPPANFTIKFYYDQSPTFQSVDGGMNWNDNDLNGGIFIKRNGEPYPMKANTKNFGNTSLSGYTVHDSVYSSNGTAIYGSNAQVSSLAAGNNITLNFGDSLVATSPGTFTNRTRITGIAGDIVPSNNTLDQEIVSVDTGNIMTLEYTDGVINGAGLGWNGGNGGIAVYIEPPAYPAKIITSRYFISANATPPVGFHAVIYDDDGPNGSHGTTLDSVFVPGNTLPLNSYKYVSHLSSNIVLNSGGVYVLWYMDGAGINIGRDLDPPFSRRTFEVLGPGWSGYRDLLTEDFMIGLRVDFPWPRAKFNYLIAQDPKINFIDNSNNNPTSWYWTFGDGDTSTTQNPNHDYLENGKYEVCLAVANSYGSDTICDTIEVNKVIPTAFFIYDATNFPTIAFFDQSIGPPLSWSWNLADTAGPVIGLQDFSYKFRNNGLRNVCLVASNLNGSSSPYCEEIEIYGIGIDELDIIELNVRPNPFRDRAIIDLPVDISNSDLRLRAINALGSEVNMQYDLNGNQLELSRGSLKDGSYIIQLFSEEKFKAFIHVVIE